MGQLKQMQAAECQLPSPELEEQDADLYPSPCRWVLARFKQMVGLRL